MKISAIKAINATLSLPGDKSISHRVALISALAEGNTTIRGFSASKDCESTLACLRALGITIVKEKDRLRIMGNGLRGLKIPHHLLDAGNSGSTIRMLSGILAGQSFSTEISGDQSLCRRPMQRIITPLRQMGAEITAKVGTCAPLSITGSRLSAITYTLPVASAQVKSCILLAGLFAQGKTKVIEPVPTRNHTELMLKEFGAEIIRQEREITINGEPQLTGRDYQVPGDVSASAFFLAATLMLPGSKLSLQNVGLNPTRTAMLDLLRSLGAEIKLTALHTAHGEAVGDLSLSYQPLASSEQTRLLKGEIIANLIDEIPIIAVLATQIEGGLIIRDAAELRVKESDRIRMVVDNLRAMGAEVMEHADGLTIFGRQQLRAARIVTAGDHRIAMAFAIAALVAEGETEIMESECVEVSFPGFFSTLMAAVQR